MTCTEHSRFLALGLLLALGCDPSTEGDDDTTAADDDTTGDPCDEVGATVAPTDANNYQFDGSLAVTSTPLAESSDPLIDWSGVTEDLQLHDLDPVADIDQVAVVVFRYLSEEEVAAGLSQDTMDMVDVSLYVNAEPGDATSVHLSDLTLFGNDIDVEQYFTEGYGTWLVTINTGTTAGVGARMAAFIRPVVGESGTELHFANDTAVLEFTVDLESLQAVQVPAATPGLQVDWTAITTDAQGNPFEAGDVDQVMVAHYPGQTRADLEGEFLDLLLVADPLWTLDIDGGTTADLSGLTSDAGAFAGVDSQSTWALALLCTTCANPAPPFLTVLEPCE